MDDNKIILRSVFGKVGQVYSINPCKDPKTNRYPDCVKVVDTLGNMIMSDAERNSGKPFIPEDMVIQVTDGQTFDLDNPYEEALWKAIEHCPWIAKSRNQRDSKGNLLIDGEKGGKRYGRAELYVYKPGAETQAKVSKRELIHRAETFIFTDPMGADGRLKIAKLLGRRMNNAPDADVKDYLLELATKDPNKIINLYTGDDLELRMLFMDAREKGVIHSKGGVYIYGDGTAIGATIDVVIAWMRDPRNRKVMELIKSEVYPELHEITNPNAKKAKD